MARKYVPTGKPRGRPKFVPTDYQREQVEMMVAIGLTHIEIAKLTLNPDTRRGISVRTLHDKFKEELNRGQAHIKARVLGSLVQRALDLNHPQGAACAIFMAKTRYGWTEKQQVDLNLEAKAGVLVVPAAMSVSDWIAQETDPANRITEN